jgi:predicted alpha/beta-hydrolase family hydrolase
VGAPDLVAAARSALDEGYAVALVEQPYRVAGRRSSPAAKQLDAAWLAAIERLAADELEGLPLIAGGRSAGARVACRTAVEANATAVLCLAFPLQPPRRRTASEDPPSRLPELEAVTVPTLVVQGEQDRFGMPPPSPTREVVRVVGDHGLKKDPAAVASAVRSWLAAR